MAAPSPDHYAQLGLTNAASPKDITAAYRRLVRRLHPDVQDDDPRADDLQRVIDAYAVLRDASRRAEYDRQFAGQHARRDPDTRTHAARPTRQPATTAQVLPLPLRAGPVRYHGPPR
jgi:curved DNA-binding protein CbpA